MHNLTITLQNGKHLSLNADSLKSFFDSCEGKIPHDVSQTALDVFTQVCKVIETKNPMLAEHVMDVATAVLANLEIT